jgi:hypothetical protein
MSSKVQTKFCEYQTIGINPQNRERSSHVARLCQETTFPFKEGNEAENQMSICLWVLNRGLFRMKARITRLSAIWVVFSINTHSDGVKPASKDGCHGLICLCRYTNRMACNVSTLASCFRLHTTRNAPNYGTRNGLLKFTSLWNHSRVSGVIHFIGFVHNPVLNE